MPDSFEQQVADALQAGAPNLALEDYWNVLDRLAPRVAAAIQAAGRFNPYSKNRDGALSALRGETP